MAETKKIKTALVSVFHKDGLDALLKKLHEEGVKFLSTGGTQKFIEGLGYPCQAVEEVTTYPSILGGRVKTLHRLAVIRPTVHQSRLRNPNASTRAFFSSTIF